MDARTAGRIFRERKGGGSHRAGCWPWDRTDGTSPLGSRAPPLRHWAIVGEGPPAMASIRRDDAWASARPRRRLLTARLRACSAMILAAMCDHFMSPNGGLRCASNAGYGAGQRGAGFVPASPWRFGLRRRIIPRWPLCQFSRHSVLRSKPPPATGQAPTDSKVPHALHNIGQILRGEGLSDHREPAPSTFATR